MGLEGRSHFVDRLEPVVDGQLPSVVVNHTASIPRSRLRNPARHLSAKARQSQAPPGHLGGGWPRGCWWARKPACRSSKLARATTFKQRDGDPFGRSQCSAGGAEV